MMPNWLVNIFAATVRRQLIWGVALVHAAMMSLFVYDLSVRQQAFLLENQVAQATSLAQNLSLMAITPLLSSDFSGVQELTMAISAYPGVVHAMVLLPNGKVVAHGERSLRGQYLKDVSSYVIGPGRQPQVLVNTPALADVVVPVMVNQGQIGWVRVGVSQSSTASKLAAITHSGLIYTLLAIAVGVLLAWWLAWRLTRRMTGLAHVAEQVRSGHRQQRARLDGRDELSHLARAFNYMLDALDAQLNKEQLLQHELQAEKELAQVTLASIGDAVITTDAQGHVTFMNAVAQTLTGWPLAEVMRQPIEQVFGAIESVSGLLLPNPVRQVLGSALLVASKVDAELVSRSDGRTQIESLATPIFSPDGQTLGCVLVFRDVSAQHLVQDRLQWQAGHDVLTGLPNRLLLADRFDRALEKSRRDGSQMAVCLLDLDRFKPVNDTFGHAVGDGLLVALTERLNQELRAVDTLTRLGGDEFVILLEDLAVTQDMEGLLTRLLAVVAEPFEVQGNRIDITGSLGYTVYPHDGADPDTLLRHADQAMYAAKQAGRNRFHCFDVLHDREQASVHQTVQRVQQALLNDELRLHYQPKVNLRNGVVEGFEALLRWQHPQDGMIPPMRFLPMLEHSDVMVDIGEWVIDAALVQLRQWMQQGQHWELSVNIAARHFQHPDFLPRLHAILSRHPEVPPCLLGFEVLETVALGDLHAMNAVIEACSDLGISFSLDDFGTGYSSLSYLKRMPVHTLKIDQSFVRDMLEDPDDLALVESIIHIADIFKLSVVAEGVETTAHAAALLQLGCDVVQGYGIARPMPADQVLKWASHYQPIFPVQPVSDDDGVAPLSN